MDGPLRTERLDPGATAAQWRHVEAASISLEERHRALELKLRDTEQRLADLVQISTDWIWETDAEHRFTYFSGRLTEVSGVEPSAVIGKTRTDIMNVALDEKAPDATRYRAIEAIERLRPGGDGSVVRALSKIKNRGQKERARSAQHTLSRLSRARGSLTDAELCIEDALAVFLRS